ncbi:MAG: hypothetical protein KBC84_08630, partial [Proteobacteria bacterium]|nr:hypothetical protein [Pseudomonadota bacterium]
MTILFYGSHVNTWHDAISELAKSSNIPIIHEPSDISQYLSRGDVLVVPLLEQHVPDIIERKKTASFSALVPTTEALNI